MAHLVYDYCVPCQQQRVAVVVGIGASSHSTLWHITYKTTLFEKQIQLKSVNRKSGPQAANSRRWSPIVTCDHLTHRLCFTVAQATTTHLGVTALFTLQILASLCLDILNVLLNVSQTKAKPICRGPPHAPELLWRVKTTKMHSFSLGCV